MDLRPPLLTMTAQPAAELPDEQHSGRWAFEPKLDGWRCLAFHRVDGGVALQSRQRKLLTTYFPEVVAAVVEQLPSGTVLDGELVVYRGGRCDGGVDDEPPPGVSLELPHGLPYSAAHGDDPTYRGLHPPRRAL